MFKKLYQSPQRLFQKISKDRKSGLEKSGLEKSAASRFLAPFSLLLKSDEKLFLPFDILLENSFKVHLSIGNEEKAIALPAVVSESLLSPSCDYKEIVNQFKESLKLSQVSLEMPDDETKKWIRCLAREANVSGKLDVVKSLRNISRAGTTGESITFVMHK